MTNAQKPWKKLNPWELNCSCTDPVTDDPKGIDVKRAINELKNDNFDLLILCLAGWIPSHAVISVTHEFKINYDIMGLAGDIIDGRIVTTAAQAGTTALRKNI